MSHTSRSARSQMPEASARALEPRLVIRGESIAHVDWLAFSLRLPEGEALGWLSGALAEAFGVPPDAWQDTGRGWQGYLRRVDLGEHGLLAYGGYRQLGTMHVSLNAYGCSLVSDWQVAQAFGESSGAHITRLDLAHDDFTGETVSVDQALSWYKKGEFNLDGRPAIPHLRDDVGSGSGRTFYVGKRENGKVCRVYEKGKQLGDPNSPWTRVEVEFRAKDRVIPWSAVSDPGPVLAGAYPCLSRLSVLQSKLRTNRRIAEMNYQQMEGWVKHAAGRALNVMCEAHQGDAAGVLSRVVRSGKPKRLVGVPGPFRPEGEQ